MILSSYKFIILASPKSSNIAGLGVPNPNFFMQLQLEQKPIYVNVNLNDYISKDPLVARQNMLKQIQDEEDDIIIQLEQLRKSKG